MKLFASIAHLDIASLSKHALGLELAPPMTRASVPGQRPLAAQPRFFRNADMIVKVKETQPAEWSNCERARFSSPIFTSRRPEVDIRQGRGEVEASFLVGDGVGLPAASFLFTAPQPF